MTISLRGDKELIAKIARLKGMSDVKRAVNLSAVHVKGKIARYPTGNQHRPQPFVSPRQRRGFFAKLRAGEIEVPYRRGMSPGSKALGRKWTIKKSDGGLTAKVGNNVDYGPLVQGPTEQTSYHRKTGWKTTDQVAEEEAKTVTQYIRDAVRKVLNS